MKRLFTYVEEEKNQHKFNEYLILLCFFRRKSTEYDLRLFARESLPSNRSISLCMIRKKNDDDDDDDQSDHNDTLARIFFFEE